MATKKRTVKLHHFVLPHKHKNQHRKAHLLSHWALLLYISLFVFLQVSFTALRTVQPGVLGTTSAITKEDVIRLTNEERQKNGLPLLKENKLLDKAAEEKAKNMFAENYWAHNSPSGLTPWVWFQQEGYQYTYAGENLARGYTTATDTVNAWMASKMGHRENLLSDKYQEIGIAVEDGVLNGEKTTLVVQHFGTPMSGQAQPAVSDDGARTVADSNLATITPSTETLPLRQSLPTTRSEVSPQQSFLGESIMINQYAISRGVVLAVIFLILALGLIDVIVMSRRKALQPLHIRHSPHIGLITACIIILFVLQAGAIM